MPTLIRIFLGSFVGDGNVSFWGDERSNGRELVSMEGWFIRGRGWWQASGSQGSVRCDSGHGRGLGFDRLGLGVN